jgi:hypothetical protein
MGVDGRATLQSQEKWFVALAKRWLRMTVRQRDGLAEQMVSRAWAGAGHAVRRCRTALFNSACSANGTYLKFSSWKMLQTG